MYFCFWKTDFLFCKLLYINHYGLCYFSDFRNDNHNAYFIDYQTAVFIVRCGDVNFLFHNKLTA